jgi:hypothetical protein
MISVLTIRINYFNYIIGLVHAAISLHVFTMKSYILAIFILIALLS